MCCVGVKRSEKQLKMPDSGKMIEIHHCIISVTRCLGEVAHTHPRTCTRTLALSYKECTCKCVHKRARNFEIKTRWMGRWEPTVAISAVAIRGQYLYSQVPTEPRFTDLSEAAAAKSGSCSVSCVHPSKKCLSFLLLLFHVFILQNNHSFTFNMIIFSSTDESGGLIVP